MNTFTPQSIADFYLKLAASDTNVIEKYSETYFDWQQTKDSPSLLDNPSAWRVKAARIFFVNVYMDEYEVGKFNNRFFESQADADVYSEQRIDTYKLVEARD